jgi:hypothetical protein
MASLCHQQCHELLVVDAGRNDFFEPEKWIGALVTSSRPRQYAPRLLAYG